MYLAHPLITATVLQMGICAIWTLAGFPTFGLVLAIVFGLAFHGLRYVGHKYADKRLRRF